MIHGIAYHHFQSLDYFYNGSLKQQARYRRTKELERLQKLIDREEKKYFKKRDDELIDSLYQQVLDL